MVVKDQFAKVLIPRSRLHYGGVITWVIDDNLIICGISTHPSCDMCCFEVLSFSFVKEPCTPSLFKRVHYFQCVDLYGVFKDFFSTYRWYVIEILV